MKKTAWKKALLVATVLTSFCGAVALAEAAPAQPTMREKAERILNESGRSLPPKQGAQALKQDPIAMFKAAKAEWEKLSPGEREAFLRKHRAEQQKLSKENYKKLMNSLSPAQRSQVEGYLKEDEDARLAYAAAKKELADQLAAMSPEQQTAVRSGKAKEIVYHPPIGAKYEADGSVSQEWLEQEADKAQRINERQQLMEQRYDETMAALTPEQRGQVEAYLKGEEELDRGYKAKQEALQEQLKQLTPEQRSAIRSGKDMKREYRQPAPTAQAPAPQARPALTPQQQEARRIEREQWEKYSPAEKKAIIIQRHAEHQKVLEQQYADSLARLTPEQRAQVEAFIKDDMEIRDRQQAQRADLRARLEQMTPEQKEAIRSGRAKSREDWSQAPRGPRHHYRGHAPQQWWHHRQG